MKLGRLFLVTILSGLVAACGVANNMDSATYSSIKSFSVSTVVKGGQVTRVYGAGENAAIALGGVIGAAASTDSEMSKTQMLQKVLEKNHIDIRKKVYDRFRYGIRDNSLVSGKLVSQGGDAVFELEIYTFGLYASGPFSSKMEPDLGVRATLKDRSGKKIWTNFSYVTALNFKGYEYTLEEYVKDPAKLDSAYDAAVAKAITTIIGTFKIALAEGRIRTV